MTATHAYVSRRSCGHPCGLMVDLPDKQGARETAKFVAKEIREGRTVERVTIEQAREIGVVYCSCAKPAKSRKR